MSTATLTEPTAADRLDQARAEYFGLLARKVRDGGLDSKDENRLRALAKEPLLLRDLKRDEAAAAELWKFKRDVSATLPAEDPTQAEVDALAEAAKAARHARGVAQVDRDTYEFCIKREAAYGVGERRTIQADKLHEMKAAIGRAKSVSAEADRALDLARAVPKVRATAAAFPELAQALGLLTVDAPAPKRRAK